LCGIIGYVGRRNAAPILIQGLKKLEYRGYDSFGISALTPYLKTLKKCGRISEIDEVPVEMSGKIGIGHTRWATHGVPDDKNAHPHTDCTNSIAVAHNGIIENYSELKRGLIERGHNFTSDTDTEVIVHLIEEFFSGDLLKAVQKTLGYLEGSYAILAIANNEQHIIAARKGSPLVVGVGDEEYFASSDMTPLLDHTQRIIFLEDDDVVSLTAHDIQIFNNGSGVRREVQRVQWDVEAARKGGFDHFMLKEIFEQPDVYYQTLNSVKKSEMPSWLCDIDLFYQSNSISGLSLFGCGTSFHAGLIFKYLMEQYCRIPVRVELASEFKYFTPPIHDVVIAVTQSGETADTISALKKADQYNCHTLAVVNVLGSSITRMADYTLYTRAGPEISVAATKSFIAQLAVFFQIVNTLNQSEFDEVLYSARQAIEETLLINVEKAVVQCSKADHIFFIGRGPFFPVALEGALKMKEITYIHAEGYAAGELKHGPFSLLSPQTPVVAICLPGDTYAVMLSNIKEIKTRGAPVICLGFEGDRELAEVVDVMLPVPNTHQFGQLLTTSVILQLLAYHTAKTLGRDIDKPRNLAKSVTVE
jgi:glucosamine--fructose-6-phosphate aminotransferase (isomerizing)